MKPKTINCELKTNLNCSCYYCTSTKPKYKSQTWWVVRSNDCCVYKQTFLFERKSEAKRYMIDHLGGLDGDYILNNFRMGKRAILELARTSYEAEHIKYQL